MAKQKFTAQQLIDLTIQTKAASEGNGRFSDIVMPNGKKLADCTFGEVDEVAEAMQQMGAQIRQGQKCQPNKKSKLN